MSNNKNNVAIRIYHNPKYGKYIGPNRKNRFVFNGTITIQGGGFFVFDATAFDEMGCSDCPDQRQFLGDMATQVAVEHFGCTRECATDYFSAMIYEYDKATRSKGLLVGAVVISFKGNEVFYAFQSSNGKLGQYDFLPLHGCPSEKGGKKSPDFIATNVQLEKVA